MTMKKTLLFTLLFSLTSLHTFAQKQSKAKQKECCTVAAKTHHQVLLHLATSDSSAHKGLINQLNGLREAFGDSVAIEVVVHGPGVDFLMTAKSTQRENIQKVIANGVQFYACENTMKARKISKEEMLPQVGFVKFGLAEIVQKQEEGWTYIKTGF